MIDVQERQLAPLQIQACHITSDTLQWPAAVLHGHEICMHADRQVELMMSETIAGLTGRPLGSLLYSLSKCYGM